MPASNRQAYMCTHVDVESRCDSSLHRAIAPSRTALGHCELLNQQNVEIGLGGVIKSSAPLPTCKTANGTLKGRFDRRRAGKKPLRRADLAVNFLEKNIPKEDADG